MIFLQVLTNSKQKTLKGIALLSHLHPQFHHFLQSHIYIHTLKLTRWLPRHTNLGCSLRAMSEGSMTQGGTCHC
jgi:hypothetical protein